MPGAREFGVSALNTISDEEARELSASVRAACERLADEERVRKVAYGDSGFDTQLWTVLCQQIGVAAVGVSESLGGGGYGASALGVIARELGRTLAPVPFLPTAVLAVGLLADLEDEKRVAALISGARTAAVAVDEKQDFTAVTTASEWTLSGRATRVLHAAHADDLLVATGRGDESKVFAVDAASAGVTIEPERVLDPTRPMATVALDGAHAVLIGEGTTAADAVARNFLRCTAVLTAEQVGAHERLLEIASEYARTRQQFGRPIGGFQAVKHRCADMLTDLEWSRSASLAAMSAIDDGSADATWLTSMAKAVCSEGLRDAAHANLQIHGGIGFTWEDSAHLYLRRARTDEVLFGGPSTHWKQVEQVAGIFS